MSLTLLLLLVFLCLSFHACNARYLLDLGNKKIEKNSHFFLKNDDNKSVDLSSKQLASLRNEEEEEEEKKTRILVVEAEKPKANTTSRRSSQKMSKVKKGKLIDSSGSLKTHKSSLVSVSWSVPHKKKGYKNPGFNLDYSPPKTHPPSHN